MSRRYWRRTSTEKGSAYRWNLGRRRSDDVAQGCRRAIATRRKQVDPQQITSEKERLKRGHASKYVHVHTLTYTRTPTLAHPPHRLRHAPPHASQQRRNNCIKKPPVRRRRTLPLPPDALYRLLSSRRYTCGTQCGHLCSSIVQHRPSGTT